MHCEPQRGPQFRDKGVKRAHTPRAGRRSEGLCPGRNPGRLPEGGAPAQGSGVPVSFAADQTGHFLPARGPSAPCRPGDTPRRPSSPDLTWSPMRVPAQTSLSCRSLGSQRQEGESDLPKSSRAVAQLAGQPAERLTADGNTLPAFRPPLRCGQVSTFPGLCLTSHSGRNWEALCGREAVAYGRVVPYQSVPATVRRRQA